MTKKIKILISNDDGIEAPGLLALWEELSKSNDAVVVAPSGERSAVSHSISINKTLKCEKKQHNGKFIGWTYEGTPVDCVKLAITFLLKDNPPDFVVSGINRGQNTSNNIIYSGTVAAAIEGAVFGIPAIAVSLNSRSNDKPDYHFAAKFVADIIPMLVKNKLPKSTILNINVPNIPEKEIKGVEITKQGSGYFVDSFVPINDISSDELYVKNIGAEVVHSSDGEENDDIAVFVKNKISITPLHFDLTCHKLRSDLKKWISHERFF